MKLASLTGGRDGRLAVVSRDLSRAAFATDIAPTLQAALDDWRHAKLALAALAGELEAGRAKSVIFNADDALAPLPRAYHWVDGSAYVARGAMHTPAAIKWTKRILREAFEVQLGSKGFSFVEILTMCPTDWYVDPIETPDWIEQNFTGTYPLKILKQP